MGICTDRKGVPGDCFFPFYMHYFFKVSKFFFSTIWANLQLHFIEFVFNLHCPIKKKHEIFFCLFKYSISYLQLCKRSLQVGEKCKNQLVFSAQASFLFGKLSIFLYFLNIFCFTKIKWLFYINCSQSMSILVYFPFAFLCKNIKV